MDEELPPYQPQSRSLPGQSAQGASQMGYREYRGTQPQMNEANVQEQFASLFQRKENDEQLSPEEDQILEYAMKLWERDRGAEQGNDLRTRAAQGKFVHPAEDAFLDRTFAGSRNQYESKEDMVNRRMRPQPQEG